MPMPAVEIKGVSLHFETGGSASAPALVFSNSLGSDLHMWDKVVPYLERDFRIVSFDARGHGLSSLPERPWSIEMLAQDLIGLLDALSIESAHVCGLSLGGMVAQWLGVHAPSRVKHLVFANTAAHIGTHEAWEARISAVEKEGMRPIAYAAIQRWFTEEYIRQRPGEMSLMRAMIEHTSQRGYVGCCEILRDTDLGDEIVDIHVPCMVVAGRHDLATPPEDGRRLHAGLGNSRYVELEASHMSAWERAAEFADAVRDFLQEGRSNGRT
jgi:3-oxoadipate enol-lactonase